MTTLRIKTTDGTPCDLLFRTGNGEPVKNGGAVLRIAKEDVKIVEIYLSATDRKALAGLLR